VIPKGKKKNKRYIIAYFGGGGGRGGVNTPRKKLKGKEAFSFKGKKPT